MEYEELIKDRMSRIAVYEDAIVRVEQVLGGRGETSIIRYY